MVAACPIESKAQTKGVIAMEKKLTLQPVDASELAALDGGVSPVGVICCGGANAIVRNVVVVSSVVGWIKSLL
jgi:hypothetical protein